MAKLKANKVKKIICPTCKGNGFVKVASLEQESMVHQCWDCDSEGEFYETVEDNNLIDDGPSSNKLH
jgi:DnaJ-class molecular chaperone